MTSDVIDDRQELIKYYQFDNMYTEERNKILFPNARIIIKNETWDLSKKPSEELINILLNCDYKEVFLMRFLNAEYYSSNYGASAIYFFCNNSLWHVHTVTNPFDKKMNSYQKICLEHSIEVAIGQKQCNSCKYFYTGTSHTGTPINCAVNPLKIMDDGICKDFEPKIIDKT
jgi:hypothetical protein